MLDLDNNAICKKYRIFIDTSGLMHDNIEVFFSNFKVYLKKQKKQIYIINNVIAELEKYKKDDLNSEFSKKAKKALKILSSNKDEYFICCGKKTNESLDIVFQTVFTNLRTGFNLLLITQNVQQAKSILSLKKDAVNKTNNEINVLRINNRGELESFSRQEDCETQNKNIEGFKLCEIVTKISDKPITVKSIPSEKDTVKSIKNGNVKLKKRLGGGGEGDVYRTNTSYIAKIYKKGKLTVRKQKKLELMVTKNIDYKGICYPVDLLYNMKNEFVGYLMPEAKGEVLQTSLFIKPRMEELFPNWKKRDIVEVAVEILKRIKYLHDRNIILGDINPMNIQIVSPTEIYFVDTDSYQIEDFPCPVGTVNFTAPELQGKKYEDYLRTFGNEYFAVATLLFMLMLPGKTPYAQQGGISLLENIKKMDFPYPFGKFSTGKAPEGPWRYCWSHLTFDIKKAFYETFMKWENVPEEMKYNNETQVQEHSSEKNRYNVDKWLKLFSYYLQLLDSGKIGEQDSMSEKIFPTRLKRNSKDKYVKCKFCAEEYPEYNLKEGICYICRNKSYKGKHYFCEKCRKEVSFTNFDYYVRGYKKPLTKCRECINKEKEVYKRIQCKDCGKSFDFSNGEHDFYLSKGWEEPTRCRKCRKKKNN